MSLPVLICGASVPVSQVLLAGHHLVAPDPVLVVQSKAVHRVYIRSESTWDITVQKVREYMGYN